MTDRGYARRLLLLTFLVAAMSAGGAFEQAAPLPNKAGSLKFAAIGDNGTGDQPQYEVARQMATRACTFPYDLVIMLGDNMYGGQKPADFVNKFEKPYAALLEAGVKFQGEPWKPRPARKRVVQAVQHGRARYYSYTRNNVRFVVLDSTQLDPKQLQWLEATLRDAKEAWKICYFHHPLYSDAARHGSSVDIRVVLEPIFVRYGVNVVFSGHDHVYERIKPQKGIYYFVSGAAGQLRKGNIRPDEETAAYFDQDQSFMLVEVSDDDMFFSAVSRTGRTVDSGVIHRTAAADKRFEHEAAQSSGTRVPATSVEGPSNVR